MIQSDFICSHLFVCIANGFEVFTNDRERDLEVKASVKFSLKLVKVGRAVPCKIGFNELGVQLAKCLQKVECVLHAGVQ